ncbi:MAG: hypothetical protein ABUL72_01955, partial [Armatimonadota bacterium]
MTPEAIYLVGVLLFWGGIACLGRAFYLGAIAWLSPQEGRSALLKPVAVLTVLAVVCLIASSAMHIDLGRKVEGPHVPVAWVYMQFPGWMVLGCLFAAVRSAMSAYTQVNPAEGKRKAYLALGWLVVMGLGVWWFVASSTRVWIFRGYLPADPAIVIGFALLALMTLYLMVAVQRYAMARIWGRGVAVTLALLTGSCLFALPLGWQILTSFKEQKDQTTANGFIWIPQVQETHPYYDTVHPLVAATFNSTPVKATILNDLGEGRKLLEVERPYSVRGRRFEAKEGAYKPIMRDALVFSGDFNGRKATGFVIEEAENGVKTLEVMSPPELKGQSFKQPTASLEPVRHVGLRWENYTEALEWLPEETRGGMVYLQNTVVLVVLKVLATLVSCALVGYGFSRLRFPGRNALFTVMLSTMML